MRIAICDDNARELEKLSTIFESYRNTTKASFTISTYSDGLSLLEDVRKGYFDLLILDILMPLVNGMQVAQEVRGFDETIQIVFLTSSVEFAVEGYSVDAVAYIVKPVTEKNLFPVIDKLFLNAQKRKEGLLIKSQNGMCRILFSQLAYVEVMNRELCFHLTDGTIKEANAPLFKYEDALLSRAEFVRVHRAFIVNLMQIKELRNADILTFTGNVIPVSRRLFAQVRKAYADFLFTEKGLD